MLPTDIPASLSCLTPALCQTAGVTTPLYRAIPELYLKTWWHCWLMTPAESCWLLQTALGCPPDVYSQRADLQLFYFTLQSWEDKKDRPDRWYCCLVWDLRSVCGRNMETFTGMSATFIYLSVLSISTTVPKRRAWMDTGFIPEGPVVADLCHAQVSIKKISKPFQPCYCSTKINATTLNTVFNYISYV